jgi:hypothetical protein
VPSAAAKGAGAEIFVSNGLGGKPGIALSDGANWLRSDTGTPISASPDPVPAREVPNFFAGSPDSGQTVLLYVAGQDSVLWADGNFGIAHSGMIADDTAEFAVEINGEPVGTLTFSEEGDEGRVRGPAPRPGARRYGTDRRPGRPGRNARLTLACMR